MSQGILCLEMGTKQQLSSCLKEELRNKQACGERPLSNTALKREGDRALAPCLPWGGRSLPALLPLPGRSVKDMSFSSDHFCELQKYFLIAKKDC